MTLVSKKVLYVGSLSANQTEAACISYQAGLLHCHFRDILLTKSFIMLKALLHRNDFPDIKEGKKRSSKTHCIMLRGVDSQSPICEYFPNR